jgi:hypothetical protein
VGGGGSRDLLVGKRRGAHEEGREFHMKGKGKTYGGKGVHRIRNGTCVGGQECSYWVKVGGNVI